MTSTLYMRFPLDWHPEIRVLHDCLRHQEFARLSLLTRISDLDWQYQVLESLGSPLTKTSLLRSWYEASPGEIAPSIALALHLVRMAYDRREDDPEGEAEAGEWVAEARAIVERVAASMPDDPRIACARIEVARVAGDRGTIRRVWEEASGAHSGFFPLLVAVLTSVSPRFFGSDEEMLEFARAQADGAQPGELRGILPVLAHAEIAASRLAFFPEVESFRAFTDPYFGQDWVGEEILQCSWIYLDGKVDVEAWKQLDVRALNFMLFTLRLSRKGVAELVEALGGRYTELPWGWLGDSREVFERFTWSVPPDDKWAREVWEGDMSSLGLIAVGLVLLYFMLPEALLSAKADRSVVSEGGFLGGPVLVHTPWVDLSVGLALSAVLLLFGGWLLMAKVTRGIARAR